jgi:hypothetical protein
MTDTQQLAAARAADQAKPKANKLVIFTWGGDLDKVWPTLILATSAAARAWRPSSSSPSGGCSPWSATTSA